MEYISKIQERWENRATVRTMPRLKFEENLAGYFFPLSKQPLCFHHEINKFGDQAISFILAQSLYKYANDIAVIETQVVNNTLLYLINDELDVKFDDSFKLNAFTIVVDEAYHAYVAYDAMLQIKNHTKINALPLPSKIEIQIAIDEVKKILNPIYHKNFDLVAICIAENTLTKEIISMLGNEETHPFFQKLINDHLSDESRHSGYFYEVLKFFWKNLDVVIKMEIINVLPHFIENYLGINVQRSFEINILKYLGFSNNDSESILNDIYSGMTLHANHPMIKNIMFLLKECDVLNADLLKIFQNKGFIL